MNFLLDTDIIIYLLNEIYPELQKKLSSIPENEISISSITVAELYFGAYNSSRVDENIQLLQDLLSELRILYLDEDSGRIFGKIKADLKKRGEIINDSDLFIASIAIRNGIRLVTNNVRHFSRVEGLKIENWT